MPIYDFACTACDERFDELARFDAPPPPCPACGGEETERLLSPFTAANAKSGFRNFAPSPAGGGCCGGSCGGGH
jgi:putative FmdB family regulatory protein